MFKITHQIMVAMCLICLTGITSTAVLGAPITGTFNFTGSAGVSAVAVDFFGGATCSTAGVGSDGCLYANVPLSGSFSTLLPGQVQGTIQDLQGPPISGDILVPSFITFSNGIFFDLTRVVPGGAPDCATVNGTLANVSCTPIVGGETSPFVLTNSSNGSNASVFFNVEGNAYSGSTGTVTSFYIGAFNTPSAGKNIAGILSDIAAGGTVTAAFSANFVGGSQVPEPETALLLGVGLIAIVISRFRFRAKSIR